MSTATPRTSNLACVGILGGMGPRATVDLFQKLVEATPAMRDSEHIPVLVYSVPQIPDRTAAILHGGPSPLEEMQRGVRVLSGAGASVIVLACNTAHHWFAELQAGTNVPLLHIADAVLNALDHAIPPGAAVGVMGTSGTVLSGLYERALSRAGYRAVTPLPDRQAIVDRGIALVKAGDVAGATALFRICADALVADRAQAIILACTEIPLALQGEDADVPLIDATAALARHCVRYCRSPVSAGEG